MQKAQADIQKVGIVNGNNGSGEEARADGGTVIHEDGTVRPATDDNASTRGMLSPSTPNGPNAADSTEAHMPIPTIRVSTESDRATRESTIVGHPEENGETRENNEVQTQKQENGTHKNQEVQGLEKPVQAAAGEEKGSSDPSPAPTAEPFSFSNKRLCERWLDNLFMVLYEVRPKTWNDLH